MFLSKSFIQELLHKHQFPLPLQILYRDQCNNLSIAVQMNNRMTSRTRSQCKHPRTGWFIQRGDNNSDVPSAGGESRCSLLSFGPFDSLDPVYAALKNAIMGRPWWRADHAWLHLLKTELDKSECEESRFFEDAILVKTAISCVNLAKARELIRCSRRLSKTFFSGLLSRGIMQAMFFSWWHCGFHSEASDSHRMKAIA